MIIEKKVAEKSGKYSSKNIVPTQQDKIKYSFSNDESRNKSDQKILSSMDIAAHAIVSRCNETKDKLISMAGIVSDSTDKVAEFISPNLEGDRPLSGYDCCSKKFDKVRRSGRNIKFINRSDYDSGWGSWLIRKFISKDQFYHSAFLYSSIRGEIVK